jgi:starch synthase
LGKGQSLPRHRRSLVRPLRVLFLSAEASPLAKVGGLGDVGGELPQALRRLGLDVRSSLPRYPSIDLAPTAARTRRTLTVMRGDEAMAGTLFRRSVRAVPYLLIDGEPVARDRAIYGGGRLEGEKFIFWCLGALAACRALRWAPDVVHAHDWHAAAAVAWLAQQRARDPFWKDTATVLTIHNLGYAGAGNEDAWRDFGLPSVRGSSVPVWARSLPLASALSSADAVTTVSPSYAREITTAESGFGLEPILRGRTAGPVGILNGIDPDVWNPAVDRALVTRFTFESLERRAKNKASLLAELGFERQDEAPLLVFIGRLERQKGIDLALQALATMLDTPWRAVVLGTGQGEMEAMASSFEQGHPGRLRFRGVFDEALSRRLYGSSDIVLVPSRYEPCGLVQMIAMRYGAVPVVHAVGGLRDTVRDHASGTGTGFVFDEPSVEALAAAIRRAINLHRDPRAWRTLQRRAARTNFSWEKPAQAYAAVFRRTLRAHRARGA